MSEADDRARFYCERDRRSVEFGLAADLFEQPVSVVVGRRAAASPRGQAATLALINMLARLHRTLNLDIPSAPLHRAALVPARTLDDAAISLARAIDPFIKVRSVSGTAPTIGLGEDAPPGLDWYCGAERQIAVVQREPVGFDEADGPSLGACMAACLGASVLLKRLVGESVVPARVSAWNVREGPGAEAGPHSLGPIDVGEVLMVGAGGVGSGLAFWLREFGAVGRWIVLDGDRVELHNTNRSLGMVALDAGWPTGVPAWKANVAANLFGAEAVHGWYDQFDQDSVRPDLVLPLANERDVRELVARRGDPLVLHATTSRTWEAQVHRHVPGLDDCISCRMPAMVPSEPAFGCSSGHVKAPSGHSTDAALPFLSGTAALLLLSALYRLQAGMLPVGRHNLSAVTFQSVRSWTRRAICNCHQDCRVTLPPQIRRTIHYQRRWSSIDPLE